MNKELLLKQDKLYIHKYAFVQCLLANITLDKGYIAPYVLVTKQIEDEYYAVTGTAFWAIAGKLYEEDVIRYTASNDEIKIFILGLAYEGYKPLDKTHKEHVPDASKAMPEVQESKAMPEVQESKDAVVDAVVEDKQSFDDVLVHFMETMTFSLQQLEKRVSKLEQQGSATTKTKTLIEKMSSIMKSF